MKRISKILIIEDNKKNLTTLNSYFSKLSDNIIIPETGSDALKNIESSIPDLIIINPFFKETSGFELIRLIKNNYKIPIITLIHEDRIAALIRAQQEGANACITLPIKEKTWDDTINKLI